MNSLNSVNPRSNLAQYNPNQEINFEMTHEGMAFQANSMYITGKLVVVKGGNATDNNYYDNFVGIGSFMENVTTECNLFQEVITNYSRLIKMMNVSTLSPDQLCSGLKNTTEMLLPNLSQTSVLLHSSQLAAPFAFCHFPKCALNNMNGNLDSVKSGKIKFSFKLPSMVKCFFGNTVANITNYYMTELELHYKTVPVGSPSVQIMISEDTQKLIQTTNTTVSNSFINPIDHVLVSFSTVDSQTDETQNSLQCCMPPINKMNWQYNDQSNSLVSYEIESVEEQILSGFSVLNSLGCGFDLRDKIIYETQDGVHGVGDKFIIGLKLGVPLNLSGTGLGLNVRIDDLTENYYAYMYGFGNKLLY